MQKLNFLIAFFVTFFFSCVVTETGTNCSCQVASISSTPASVTPVAESMSVSPDLLSDAGAEDLVDTEMSVDSDVEVDSAAEVLATIQ